MEQAANAVTVLLRDVLCHLGLPSVTLLALPALSRAAAPGTVGVQSLIEALFSYISGSYPWLHIGTTWRTL